MTEGFFQHWTLADLQGFLLESGLAISTGADLDDEMALTARGRELAEYLAMVLMLSSEPPMDSNLRSGQPDE